jgi:hypothetical protein
MGRLGQRLRTDCSHVHGHAWQVCVKVCAHGGRGSSALGSRSEFAPTLRNRSTDDMHAVHDTTPAMTVTLQSPGQVTFSAAGPAERVSYSGHHATSKVVTFHTCSHHRNEKSRHWTASVQLAQAQHTQHCWSTLGTWPACAVAGLRASIAAGALMSLQAKSPHLSAESAIPSRTLVGSTWCDCFFLRKTAARLRSAPNIRSSHSCQKFALWLNTAAIRLAHP